jgi:sulfur carrier protein
MQIQLNGKSVELNAPMPLAELLKRYEISSSTGQVAVALNEQIAFRPEWDVLVVKDGDRIEIIHAVQGG